MLRLNGLIQILNFNNKITSFYLKFILRNKLFAILMQVSHYTKQKNLMN